jgi:hypothetical protein
MANLFLYSPELKAMAWWIAGIWKIDTRDQKPFSSLNDMAREIGRYEFLDQLVIFCHGAPGQISLQDGNNYKLSEPAVAKAFAKVKTQADHIRFEGCWVGADPDEMAAFGLLLRAVDVSGFTWEHFEGAVSVTIPRGVKPEQVEKLLAQYWRWRAPFPPVSFQYLASLSRNSDAKYTLSLEWFKQYDISSNPKRPWEVEGMGGLAPRGFKIRSQAENCILQYKNGAVQRNDGKTGDHPIDQFSYITVKMNIKGNLLDI